MRRCVNRPFVLVAPVRQKGMEWWVLTKSGDWGWVEGDLNAARIQLFSAWIQHLGEDAGIDAGQISLFGYSANGFNKISIGGLPTDKWVEVKRANAQGSGSRRSLVSKAIDGDEAEQESRERQLHKKRKHTRDDGDPGADTVWY